MGRGKKWYVVWQGVEPGIYESWTDCKLQINGYQGARYKSFLTYDEARVAYEDGPDAFYRKNYGSEQQAHTLSPKVILPSLCVDAACSGNPGPVEYRGVLTANREQIFKIGPLQGGSNNIGEFLAIVHALAFLKKQGADMPVYSDSVTAMSWVRNKKCKTLIPRTPQSEPLFNLIARAEDWLKSNTYNNRIIKWDTPNWGEIPADFGRK
ncbi:ribonuclease H [Porphyromonas macacae]|uniref:Ribonuclease H n=1 Tax=Porphyromonas macacae TaxID=28115 RepID=A0A0A2E939_9PORP|nr:ribonuclease H family protein [Porphyromonas macacae]KGN74182.1 ribonuclease H [Porphyromonas macacae]SUB89933.1 Ribonuclease H [Porphyromonas macacae]